MKVDLDPLVLLPVLAPAVGVLLVLLLDAVAPRLPVARPLGVAALVVAAAGALPGAIGSAQSPVRTLCTPHDQTGTCLYVADPAASSLQIGIIGAVLAVLLLGSDALRTTGAGAIQPRVRLVGGSAVQVALLLAAAAGGAGVVAARDLGSWLVLLELATLPPIGLVALHTGRRTAGAALTLLMTALVSFALLVVGIALWLTATGSATFSTVAARTAAQDPAQRAVLLLAGLTLLAGLGFKLSLVPFHAWTPTAFTGASLPVAALLATASKLAATGALLVVLTPFAVLAETAVAVHALAAVLGGLAVVSILFGAVVVLRSNDVLRFLAFSTIGQAGWVVLPLAALTGAGRSAAAGYALTFAAASLVVFAAVAATTPDEDGARELTAYTSLLRTRPLVGAPLALALFVLAGLPPGIIGLVAKIQALRPLVDVALWPLAVVAVAGVVIGIAAYLRWVAVLLARPVEDGDVTGAPVSADREAPVGSGRGAATVLGLGSVILVVTSVVPQLLWGLTR